MGDKIEILINGLKTNILTDIIQFCETNEIEDFVTYFNNLVYDAFMVEKFGDKPFNEDFLNKSVVIPQIDIEEVIEVKKVEEPIIEKILETPITDDITLVENKKRRRTIKTK